MTDDPDGRAIFKCLKKCNTEWDRVTVVANRILVIYQYTSDTTHATAHSIAHNETTIVVDKLAYNIQIYNAMVCIASTLGIRYEVRKET